LIEKKKKGKVDIGGKKKKKKKENPPHRKTGEH